MPLDRGDAVGGLVLLLELALAGQLGVAELDRRAVGVESLDEPNAVVMVYTNTTSTSPLTKNIPSLKYLSYRLFMKRTNGRWLVTRMTTITSLDLTPHL